MKIENSIQILYDDNYILIVNKDSGLLTHQSKLSPDKDSLVDRLRAIYDFPPSPVHRLDRPTSGLIICSYSSDVSRILGNSFLQGSIEKSYLAIVRGFTDEIGEINIPLKKDGDGVFQDARTIYHTLKKMEIPIANNKYNSSRYSLLEVKPKTGRFHQIRRHMARIGHPILGDTSHGDLRHNRIFETYFSNERLLLHSSQIILPHPVTGEKLTISAPVPNEMQQIINEF